MSERWFTVQMYPVAKATKAKATKAKAPPRPSHNDVPSSMLVDGEHLTLLSLQIDMQSNAKQIYSITGATGVTEGTPSYEIECRLLITSDLIKNITRDNQVKQFAFNYGGEVLIIVGYIRSAEFSMSLDGSDDYVDIEIEGR